MAVYIRRSKTEQDEEHQRDDVTDTTVGRAPDAMDHYVHSYYEDVNYIYRNKMFQLYICSGAVY